MKFKFFPLAALACFVVPAIVSSPIACAVPIKIEPFKLDPFKNTPAKTEPVNTASKSRNTSRPVPVKSNNIARLPQSDARLTRLENLMFNYVNAAREKQGLKPLALDSALSEVSRAHSAEMRDKDYFAHESPTPELRDPLDRYQLGIGGTPRLVAENIFRAWGSRKQLQDADALRAHNSLMNSPGHRANILREGPTRIGIGFVANANGDLWVTQMFSRP